MIEFAITEYPRCRALGFRRVGRGGGVWAFDFWHLSFVLGLHPFHWPYCP